MTRRIQERQTETGGGFLPRSGLVQEPYQDVIWATRGGFLRHKRRSSVPKTHHEMVWSPQPACTKSRFGV